MKKFALFFIASFTYLTSFSQAGGTNCGDMEPICTDAGVSFTANTGEPDASTTDPGNDYGCLFSSPNPSWYYLEISDAGDINMNLSAPSDIDFIVWGPFNNLTDAQNNCGSLTNIVDCSYSFTNNETPSITNAQVGEVYILLVTNYANTTQQIDLNQSSGAGGTDCTIVQPNCLITYFEANISACITGTGTYDVTGVVEFEDAPASGNLIVEDCFGTQHVVASAPFANPGTVNYTINGLPADGAACSLTAYFSDEATCVNGPINYTAPTCPCNFTNITRTVSACDPADNTFEITGLVEFINPPTTGTLTISDCNGNSQVFNAPFTSPSNYALTGIDSDGTTNCEITATFSDNPGCNVVFGPFDYPQNCSCSTEIGTFSDAVNGDANSNAPWSLCFGDALDITGNGDVTLPQDFNVGGATYDPGVWLLAFSCPPATVPPADLLADPCLLGIASTADQAWSIVNNIGDNSTVYFVPVTMYSMVDGVYAISINNGDWCYDLGPAYQVNFLQEITTTQVQDCQAGTATVTVNGGLPSFDGSQFTASNLAPGSAAFDNTTAGDGGTITISGLVDGDNWSFDITDDNGCPISVSGTFSGIEDPTFTYPNNVYCESQTDPVANITGTPGGTFTVNPGGLIVDANSGLIDLSSATGTYTITYTTPDPLCFDSEDFIVTINPEPIIDPLADQEECGTYTLPAITGTNLTGNEAYYDAPNGGGTQFNPGDAITSLGTTTLYIYDETGTVPNCFNEQTFDVTINFSPVIDPIADQIECDSYTLPAITGLNLTGNEAYYTGSGSAGTQFNAGDVITASGTTTLFIYDETGTVPNCFNEQSFDVTINLTPVIDPLANQQECDSYTLPAITGTNLTGNEAYYDAPNGGGTQYNAGDNITTVGTTTLYIYDETATTPNCFNEQTFDVTINNTPVVDPLADQVECDSYTLPAITGTDLTGNEAYYDAPNGGGTQYNAGDNITAAGTTTLYIYDETGGVPNCFNEQTFDVTINITPTFALASADPTICGAADGTITLSGLEPNTAYDITYSDGGVAVGPANMNSDAAGDIVIGGLSAGSYSNFVVTLNGCTATDNSAINLVDPNAPSVDAGADQEICEGGDVTLTANNPDGANISWDNGVTDGAVFNPGVGTVTYTVTADLLGCISTDQVDVIVHPNPIVFAGNDVLICEGESVTLTGSGANSYVWDNGVTDGVTFSPSSTQTYTVVGTSAEGCVGTDDVTVTIEPLPVVSFEADNFEGCVPVTVTFTNTSSVAGTDCTWNFGDGSTATGCGQVTHTFNSVGCFDVTLEVTSANGCTSTSTLTDYICVGGYPNAAFNFSPDQLTNLNTQAQFTNSSSGATSYQWNFGDGQTSTEVNPSHDYPAVADSFNVQLVATSPFGCTDTANAIVPIIEELIFYVPNTFTPDNDDFNEVFKPIFTSGFDPFDYNLLIFNRWGEIVFESNDSEVGWDGTYGAASEDLVKDGTYVWKITFKTKINDERVVETGHVNLLK